MASLDWKRVARALFSNDTPQHVADARLTRTPIYTTESYLPDKAAATYADNKIYIRPDELKNNSNFVLPHEQAHQIFDSAGLRSLGGRLAGRVGEGPHNRVAASSLYDSSPETMADEGLGYSVGDRDETPYVNYAASQISNPALKEKLLRLHNNAVQTRRLGGMGSLR